MNKIDAYDRETLKAEQVKVLMNRLGGNVIADGAGCRRFNFVATLPTIDENTRFFEVKDRDPFIINLRHIGEMYSYRADYVTFLTIDNEMLGLEFGAKNTNCSWSLSDARKGLVYGFIDKPKVIDRSFRICISSGYGAVQIPLGKIDDHRAIRVVK